MADVTTAHMPTGRWIDSHCHLDGDYGPGVEPSAVIERAHQAGVTTLITIGCDWGTSQAAQRLSERNESVWFTVGVHPHEAARVADLSAGTQPTTSKLAARAADSGAESQYARDHSPIRFEQLATLASHPRCVAIGEIGLDYYYEHSERAAQREALELGLTLALERSLPVVIHSREGETDLLPALKRYAARASSALPHPGVIHCFSGSPEFGRTCLELGFLISFSGILTFKNAAPLRELAAEFPLDRLLVETDAPWLAPVPYRGKLCEPRMVLETARCLAQVRGLSLEQVALATTANAERFFGLSHNRRVR